MYIIVLRVELSRLSVGQQAWSPSGKASDSKSSLSQLICAFVFATWIVQSLFYLCPEFPAFFCDCTCQFASDLIEKPKDRYSGIAARLVVDHRNEVSCDTNQT